jgi:hypothetical protein
MARNDPPSNLRMRFGYKEAKDAGVPFVPPKSGKRMNEDIKVQRAIRHMQRLAEEDPAYKSFIGFKLVAGCNVFQVYDEVLRFYSAQK